MESKTVSLHAACLCMCVCVRLYGVFSYYVFLVCVLIMTPDVSQDACKYGHQ